MSNTDVKNLSAEELARLVTKLQYRVEKLEKSVADLKATRPVPEEDLAVIAATAAAYMGCKGTVKAIHFAGRSPLASA